MPVARVRNALKRCRTTKLNRISVQSAVYLTGVLEYLVAEILELSGNAAQVAKRKRIIPRHIRVAVGNDQELNDLCKGVVMPEGGVIGTIHPVLLPTAKRAVRHKKAVAAPAEGNDDANADAEPEL
ncbi:Histone core [Aphelenchoides avenae]|nr:Histone core [Aphelenchus avenae]